MSSIEQLEDMPLKALKKLYSELMGTSPPVRANRIFIRRNIAWAQQVIESGKKPIQVRKKWVAVAGQCSVSSRVQYLPGTRLIREWQGETHEVMIAKKGYLWQDKHYRSLSHIAREITGAHWSGPRFFGLRNRSASGTTAD